AVEGRGSAIQLAQAPGATRSEPGGPLGADLPPIEGAPEVPNLRNAEDLPPALRPLPEEDRAMPEPEGEGQDADTELPPLPDQEPGRPRISAPILPGTQRITEIITRQSNSILTLDPTPEGVQVTIIRGGVNIVTTTPQHGI